APAPRRRAGEGSPPPGHVGYRRPSRLPSPSSSRGIARRPPGGPDRRAAAPSSSTLRRHVTSRHVAARLTTRPALQLFEQVTDVRLGVLAALVPARALDLQRREVVILRSAGRHQSIAKLAHEIVDRPLASGQPEVDGAVPGAEIPDLFRMPIVEHVPVEL